MLPANAKTFFDKRWASASADASIKLSRALHEFERAEASRGQRPDGAGYASRMGRVYHEHLTAQAGSIVDLLRTVHQSFGSPITEGVEEQLKDWGLGALSCVREHLDEEYERRLRRFGVQPAVPLNLDLTYARASTIVSNVHRQHLWELRNVPAMNPHKSDPVSPVINLHAENIGSVQVGSHATATAQHVGAGPQREQPRARRWVIGIATVVAILIQTTGAAKPAYQVLQDIATKVGVNLPDWQ